MKSPKDCEQELVFGESTYEVLVPYLNRKAPEAEEKEK